MLIDTSAWIAFFNNSKTDLALYIDGYLDTALPIHTCPTIVQEVLQGIKHDKDFRRTAYNLQTYKMLLFTDQVQAAIDAAHIYRNCRKKGITIRKANDCLIALYALANNVEILHWDTDFNAIAKVYPLKINPYSKS